MVPGDGMNADLPAKMKVRKNWEGSKLVPGDGMDSGPPK